MKYHVVHLTSVHHPLDTRIFYKQCRSADKAGLKTTLIVTDHEDLRKVDSGNIHIIAIKPTKNRWLRIILSPIRVWRAARKLEADLFHFHDPELLPVGWLLKKRNNVVIYDIHEDYMTSIRQKSYIPPIFRNLIAKLYKLVEKLFIHRMEICLAERYYMELYPRGQCILNYPIIYPNDSSLEERNESSLPLNNLLYTGNVTKDRGALIHARLPLIDKDVHVHYIGKCSSQTAQEIMEAAGEAADRVHLTGVDRFVPREQIDQEYKRTGWFAGLALFPPTEHYMKKELTKFFEYMLAGIPIICSNFPVWESFVKRYRCGIAVNPADDQEIKAAIQYLRDHPMERTKMGQRGREAVLNELNWSNEEKKLIDFYYELLGRVR